MGYKWYSPYYLSDSESYLGKRLYEIFTLAQMIGFVMGLSVSIIGLPVLGHKIGGIWLALVGFALGCWISYAFIDILEMIFKWIILIGFGGGIIAVMVYKLISI